MRKSKASRQNDNDNNNDNKYNDNKMNIIYVLHFKLNKIVLTNQ